MFFHLAVDSSKVILRRTPTLLRCNDQLNNSSFIKLVVLSVIFKMGTHMPQMNMCSSRCAFKGKQLPKEAASLGQRNLNTTRKLVRWMRQKFFHIALFRNGLLNEQLRVCWLVTWSLFSNIFSIWFCLIVHGCRTFLGNFAQLLFEMRNCNGFSVWSW